MSKDRFRSKNSVSQYLFREWQKLSGNFQPRNIQRHFSFFSMGERNAKLVRAICGQKSRVICINDDLKTGDMERIRQEIQGAFQVILPERSSYEK